MSYHSAGSIAQQSEKDEQGVGDPPTGVPAGGRVIIVFMSVVDSDWTVEVNGHAVAIGQKKIGDRFVYDLTEPRTASVLAVRLIDGDTGEIYPFSVRPYSR